MTRFIEQPMMIEAADNKPKFIEEFIGGVNSETKEVSIARMRSPGGWLEPGQTPEFGEYIVVLQGMLQVKTAKQIFQVHAGQALIVSAGEWVQYSTPSDEGAEYFAVCIPAFSRDKVHRDASPDK
ncbi:MAG: cupin [Desulfobulbaceae bacterium BRH_c16a]|nr:MAG: cupin [Desulfobulbaceae bacterium BRH_c16a]